MIVVVLFFEQEHILVCYFTIQCLTREYWGIWVGGGGQGGLGENFLSEFVSLPEFGNLSVLLTSTTRYVMPSTDCEHDLLYK